MSLSTPAALKLIPTAMYDQHNASSPETPAAQAPSAEDTPQIASPSTREERMLAEVQRAENEVLDYLRKKKPLEHVSGTFPLFLSGFSWLEGELIRRSVRQRLARNHPPSRVRFSFSGPSDSGDWFLKVRSAAPLQPYNLKGLFQALRSLSKN